MKSVARLDHAGIALASTDGGYRALDIGSGAFGAAVGDIVAYRVLTSPHCQRARNVGAATIAAIALITARVAPHGP